MNLSKLGGVLRFVESALAPDAMKATTSFVFWDLERRRLTGTNGCSLHALTLTPTAVEELGLFMVPTGPVDIVKISDAEYQIHPAIITKEMASRWRPSDTKDGIDAFMKRIVAITDRIFPEKHDDCFQLSVDYPDTDLPQFYAKHQVAFNHKLMKALSGGEWNVRLGKPAGKAARFDSSCLLGELTMVIMPLFNE